MKNNIHWIVILVAITCYGCGNDSVGIQNGNIIDELKIVILDGYVIAERMTPDLNDPGSYNFYSEFTVALMNTSDNDTIFDVSIVSAQLYLTSINEYLQTIHFKEIPVTLLSPGEIDTIVVENLLGNDKIHDPPCQQAVHFKLTITDETGRRKYHWTEEYILTCLPPPSVTFHTETQVRFKSMVFTDLLASPVPS